MPDSENIQSLVTELKRGSLTLAALGCLREPRYGYELLQIMQKKGMDVEANTLYPLLRRLGGQGILDSRWDVSGSRPKKYYTVSVKGREVYAGLLAEWERMRVCIADICGEDLLNDGFN